MISIAIDGPSGAGKSTLARRLAGELGYIYVDTGALYRSIGLYALRCGADTKNEAAVAALLPEIRLTLQYENGGQVVRLNGENVSDAIRAEAVSMAASDVSAHPAVRAFLLRTQREMAEQQNILMDGRDIGTVILPDARVKIFLTASAGMRARRRLAQMAEKGMKADYDEVLRDIEQRDYQDTHRAAAPLRQAPDAVLVDTSEMTFEQSFQKLLELIRTRIG